MKKKINYLLVCLLFWLTFAGNVYADNISISAVADNSQIVKGETAVITIKLTADVAISQCKFKIESDEGIVYDSPSSTNGWNLTGTGVDGFLVENSLSDTNKPENYGILKLKYVVNNSGKVTVKTEQCVSAIDDKGLYPQDSVAQFTVIEKEDDTTLRSLSVIGGKAFTFDPTVLNYAVTLESSTFGLVFETNNTDYQDDVVVKVKDGDVITDVNNITFNDPSGQGQMILNIIVNGQTTYEIDAVYMKKELDNSLEFIKINDADLSIQKDKIEYVVEIDKDVKEVLVAVGLKDSTNFQISKNSNIDPDTLKAIFPMTKDEEFAYIVVEPKDSSSGATSATYTIHIKRKGSTSAPPVEEEKPSNSTESEKTDTPIENPDTGGISMFTMAIVLIASLIGSIYLYRRNLEGYR